MTRSYKFGFILTVKLGNSTRFRILKKYAEREKLVELTWAPIDYEPANSSFVRFVSRMPGFLRWRLIVLYQSAPVLSRLNELDAVMVHQIEPSVLLSVRRNFARRPVLVSSTDDVPLVPGRKHALYANEMSRSKILQRLRLRLDLWRVNRADLTIPMSHAAAEILISDCGVPANSVRPFHVGLDLENWPPRSLEEVREAKTRKILFVGGDFERKGGNLLLQVHQQAFSDDVELHLVTTARVKPGCKNVFAYDDILPNDPRLHRLYIECDLFVLPTYSDLSPWVVLEAMASYLPVISTKVGGIADMVQHLHTGLLIESGNSEQLEGAIRKLLDDPVECRQMGLRAREIVERDFSAEINVKKIIDLMKNAVDIEFATRNIGDP